MDGAGHLAVHLEHRPSALDPRLVTAGLITFRSWNAFHWPLIVSRSLISDRAGGPLGVPQEAG